MSDPLERPNYYDETFGDRIRKLGGKSAPPPPPAAPASGGKGAARGGFFVVMLVIAIIRICAASSRTSTSYTPPSYTPPPPQQWQMPQQWEMPPVDNDPEMELARKAAADSLRRKRVIDNEELKRRLDELKDVKVEKVEPRLPPGNPER